MCDIPLTVWLLWLPGGDGCQPHLQGAQGQPGEREVDGGVWAAHLRPAGVDPPHTTLAAGPPAWQHPGWPSEEAGGVPPLPPQPQASPCGAESSLGDQLQYPPGAGLLFLHLSPLCLLPAIKSPVDMPFTLSGAPCHHRLYIY